MRKFLISLLFLILLPITSWAPVNPRTGNFYLPVQDLFLPCFGIPLEVYRAYNSFSRANGPFGIGWTFNYDISISIGDVGDLKVIEADGFVNEFQPAKKKKEFKGGSIDKIIEARKKEDIQYLKRPKSEEFYDKMRIKLATDGDYFRRLKSRYLSSGDEKEVADGTYISTARGSSKIIKSKDSYIRIKENGNKEYYNKDGNLTRIEDRNGNYLEFKLDKKGKVKRVNDGCRHHLIMTYNKRGKIVRIVDSIGRELQYKYDGEDRMIASVGTDGKLVKYSYGKAGNLVEIVDEKKQTIEINYDKKRRVTQQRGPDRKITKYRYGSKGPTHKWTLVKDNKGYYERLDFYENERKTVQTDKEGNKIVTVLSRTCSKPETVSNGKDRVEKYDYNASGDLIKKIDADGKIIQYKYEPNFNQISEITDHYGNKLKFLYDSRGNLTYANLAKRGHVKIRYEKHGKVASLGDHKGNMILFTYNFFGKPTRIQKRYKNKIIGAIHVRYSKTGEIADIKYKPDDIKIVNDIKDTLSNIFALLKPAGIDFRI